MGSYTERFITRKVDVLLFSYNLLQLPGLTTKNTGHGVTFEFQI